MLHYGQRSVNRLLLDGLFEVEREGLRSDKDGFLANDILDFKDCHNEYCTCKFEIRSGVHDRVEKALDALLDLTGRVQVELRDKDQLLWPFSNPCYVKDADDIVLNPKFMDVDYLAKRYGKYKLLLCGVHLHFSFGEKLLEEDFKFSSCRSMAEYKDRLYVHLCKQLSLYGWLLTFLVSSSPLCDRSFFQKGVFDGDVYSGMSSLRNSELGVWNYFAPCFDYLNLDRYVKSIEYYVEEDLLKKPNELFFPVRLMPKGEHNFMALKENGVDNIELRMFDINPYCLAGVDVRDLKFAHLFMVFLACKPSYWTNFADSVHLVQNFKNAAHYDLKTVFIRSENEEEEMITMVDSAVRILDELEIFYQDFDQDVLDVLQFEKDKCLNVKDRYAYKVMQDFSGSYVKKGLVQAEKLQNNILKARD